MASFAGRTRLTSKNEPEGYLDMGRLDGRVAIITGAASGIGAAAARRFVAEGAKVVVADINEAGGAKVAAELGPAGRFVYCDHTDGAQCAAAVQTALDAFGKLDILFNNAGLPFGGPIGRVDDELLARVIDVNLIGPFRMSRAAVPALAEGAKSLPTGAAIVFTSSMQGVIARPNLTPYTAAKHGVVGLMKSLALELAAENVRVNAICPVATDSPMFAGFLPSRLSSEQVDTVKQRVVEAIPLKRIAQPDDSANAALFLASAEAGMITGVALPVDGGTTAG